MSKLKLFFMVSVVSILLLGCKPAASSTDAPKNYRQENGTITSIDISTLSDQILERLTNDIYLTNMLVSDQELESMMAQGGAIVLNDCSTISKALGRDIQKIVIVNTPESLMVVYSDNSQEVHSF